MYIAAKGGEHAIQQAEQLYHALKSDISKDAVELVERLLPYALDKVMGEASLYAPQLAALAFVQTGGDHHEAVMLLRAFRSTQPRLAYAEPVGPDDMLTVRRISAAFKDIPGGQVLGPTLDYSHRLLRLDVLDGGAPPDVAPLAPAESPAQPSYPRVADWQREQGIVAPAEQQEEVPAAELPDITRGPLLLPVPREHRLQALSRAETGGILSLGYANMRGYGAIHPTVNELRLAYAEVRLKHPVSGAQFSIGRVRVSQAEVIGSFSGTRYLDLGFAATFGWNEVKVIAGSMLDMAMDRPNPHPAHEEEFVLYHTEPVESSGFCIHFKLPHYVTFNSALDSFRNAALAMGWSKGPTSQEEARAAQRSGGGEEES